MNREQIVKRINNQFPFLRFPDTIESALISFSNGDYKNPKRTVNFPIKVEGVYGSGGHAIILKVRDKKDKIYALRIADSLLSLNQIRLQQALVGYDMAPEILYVGKVPNFHMSFTILDVIQTTFNEYINSVKYNPDDLFTALKCLLDKKYLLGFLHGDLNLSNVVILGDGSTLGLIDFDWSFFVTNGELNLLDVIPLLGDFSRVAFKSRENIKLLNLIKNYYKTTFGITIDVNKITNPRSGGFYYGRGRLNSYIADKNLEDVARAVRKTFPSLTLPRIVD